MLIYCAFAGEPSRITGTVIKSAVVNEFGSHQLLPGIISEVVRGQQGCSQTIGWEGKGAITNQLSWELWGIRGESGLASVLNKQPNKAKAFPTNTTDADEPKNNQGELSE